MVSLLFLFFFFHFSPSSDLEGWSLWGVTLTGYLYLYCGKYSLSCHWKRNETQSLFTMWNPAISSPHPIIQTILYSFHTRSLCGLDWTVLIPPCQKLPVLLFSRSTHSFCSTNYRRLLAWLFIPLYSYSHSYSSRLVSSAGFLYLSYSYYYRRDSCLPYCLLAARCWPDQSH